MKTTYKDIEEYINSASLETQEILKQILLTIRHAAPKAKESISYGMPAFSTDGKPLLYFAVFKKHIGFYATPTGHKKFADELSKYKQGRGSVQFPLDQPIPFDLIERITRYRVKENLSKSK
jgi:uncharacterized protein YdhG (YjbR/CyaY superfamily)